MKLITKAMTFMLLLFFIESINSDQFMSVFLQRCYATCNKQYCNISYRCRPLNRTSKISSLDIYFRPGVKLEAPLIFEIIAYKKFRTVYRQHMLKLKAEYCSQLNHTKHPFFSLIWKDGYNGNVLDPCPIIGHRYVKPYVPKFDHFPLVPVGEWRLDMILSKNLNDSVEVIISSSEFYEIKPTSAVEF